MTVNNIPSDLRIKDVFHHIDMGFLNRRLCITALPNEIRSTYIERQKPGTDLMTVVSNDHLLVTMLLDVCEANNAPTLLEALALNKQKCMFRSTEQLAPCSEIYDASRVDHVVLLDIDFGKPVNIAYHTTHLVSDTGKMTLARGAKAASIVGLLHNKVDRFEIEPLVIGAPWFDHPRNGSDSARLLWLGLDIGEILPEDIDQFSKMKDVKATSANEWINVMQSLTEKRVK